MHFERPWHWPRVSCPWTCNYKFYINIYINISINCNNSATLQTVQCPLLVKFGTWVQHGRAILTNALVPVEVLHKSDGTLAAVSSGQVDTSILTCLFIATLIEVLAWRSTWVRLISARTLTAVTTWYVLTSAFRLTQVRRLTAFIDVCTHTHGTH